MERVSDEIPVGGVVEVDWAHDLVFIGNLKGVFTVFVVLVDFDDPSLKKMIILQTILNGKPNFHTNILNLSSK